MIELNLLPDIKQEYLKAERTKRLFISLSVMVAAISVLLLGILLVADQLQKKHLADVASDITKQSSTLKNETDINKILTVQNQLESLTNLHASKPEASQLFTYMNQITPVEVNINNLTVDFAQNTITVIGSTNALSSVNKYVDTVKLTTYTTKQNQTAKPAFTNVVLSSFSLNTAADPATAASYSITFNYDVGIFNITDEAKLTVPSTTTTRVGSGNSNDLFKSSPTNSGGTQNGQ